MPPELPASADIYFSNMFVNNAIDDALVGWDDPCGHMDPVLELVCTRKAEHDDVKTSYHSDGTATWWVEGDELVLPGSAGSEGRDRTHEGDVQSVAGLPAALLGMFFGGQAAARSTAASAST